MARLLVNVDVDDLDRAVRFYVAALDLRVGRRFDGVVELLGAEAPIYFLVAAEGTSPFDGAPVMRSYERHWTPVHLDFAVDDLDSAVRQAQSAGAKLEKASSDRRWGRFAVLSDPFGNGFCLLQFVGRGYDEIATGVE
jgi:lactoylglutathione lyase